MGFSGGDSPGIRTRNLRIKSQPGCLCIGYHRVQISHEIDLAKATQYHYVSSSVLTYILTFRSTTLIATFLKHAAHVFLCRCKRLPCALIELPRCSWVLSVKFIVFKGLRNAHMGVRIVSRLSRRPSLLPGAECFDRETPHLNTERLSGAVSVEKSLHRGRAFFVFRR